MANETRKDNRGGAAWSLATSNAANMLTTLIVGGALFATLFYAIGELRAELRLTEERLTALIASNKREAAENLRLTEERLTALIAANKCEAAEDLREARTEAAENLREARAEAAENLRKAEERLTALIERVAARAAEDLRSAKAELAAEIENVAEVAAANLRESERRTNAQIAALVARFDGYALQAEQFRDGLKDDLHRIAIGMKMAEEERATAKERAEALEREVAELSFAAARGLPPFDAPRRRAAGPPDPGARGAPPTAAP